MKRLRRKVESIRKKKSEDYDSMRLDKKRIKPVSNKEAVELDKVIRKCMMKSFPESGTSRFVVRRHII